RRAGRGPVQARQLPLLSPGRQAATRPRSIVRADQLLVARGLAASRTRARELIDAGAVRVRTAGGDEPVGKPSAQLADDAELLVDDSARPRHVSRGGLKLE